MLYYLLPQEKEESEGASPRLTRPAATLATEADRIWDGGF